MDEEKKKKKKDDGVARFFTHYILHLITSQLRMK